MHMGTPQHSQRVPLTRTRTRVARQQGRKCRLAVLCKRSCVRTTQMPYARDSLLTLVINPSRMYDSVNHEMSLVSRSPIRIWGTPMQDGSRRSIRCSTTSWILDREVRMLELWQRRLDDYTRSCGTNDSDAAWRCQAVQ